MPKTEPERAAEDEFLPGVEALLVYGGRGMVQLLDVDREERNVLMERVLPGETLWQAPIATALDAVASVLKQIRQPAPGPRGQASPSPPYATPGNPANIPTMPVVKDQPTELLAPAQQRLDALERLTHETDGGQWTRICAAEGWPVALVCYHIARGFDRQASFIEGVAAGVGPHRYSWDETHDLNERIAGEHPLPTPEEVLATARAAIERVRRAVSGMEPTDLGAIAFVNGSFQGDVEWLVRTLMPQHADGHLASIASALAD